MFRKIHSNRDPRDTLYSEIRREFGDQLQKTSAKARQCGTDYPKTLFGGMIILLVLSAALSFTVFRHPVPKANQTAVVAKSVKKQPSLDEGFEQILATGAALKTTLHLKTEVQMLLTRGHLAHADSLALEKALDSLSQIHHQIHLTNAD